MFTGHLPELVIVLVIALIVFGPQRLPEVTRSLGGAVREFRRATAELQESVMAPADPEPEIEFPHTPPDPDAEADATSVAPAIDTLAQRRERRAQSREAAPDSPASDASVSPPPDSGGE